MMNKYIKKYLVAYISLAVIMCGMVGAAYAITAADAYSYVTRSEYATDMSYLQSKLDETESTLMGQINRYRSTDVKFVTWDTPTKYDTSAADGGYHNGGNYNVRKYRSNTTSKYMYGYSAASLDNKRNGRYSSYSIFRIWNGNYYFTKDIFYREHASSPYDFNQTLNYLLPVENFPGWYVEVKLLYQLTSYIQVYYSLIRLDPTATSTPLPTDTLQLRFKKDLFQYCGDSVTPLTTTKITTSLNSSHYTNSPGVSPLSFHRRSLDNSTGTTSVNVVSWIDETTGDYMMTIRGITRCYATSNSSYTNICYYLGNSNTTMCKLIPIDNVEYMCGNIYGNYWTYNHDTGRLAIPSACAIGTGFLNDPYWTYEFVDCINGLKYWHAYRPPSTVQKGNTAPIPFGIHYSLPIVY